MFVTTGTHHAQGGDHLQNPLRGQTKAPRLGVGAEGSRGQLWREMQRSGGRGLGTVSSLPLMSHESLGKLMQNNVSAYTMPDTQ